MFDFDNYFKRLFSFYSLDKVEIPEDAVKEEKVLEQNGYRTVTTTWTAKGFSYTSTVTESLPKEESQLDKAKRLLAEAVQKEDYRQAAELQEQVKRLEAEVEAKED